MSRTAPCAAVTDGELLSTRIDAALARNGLGDRERLCRRAPRAVDGERAQHPRCRVARNEREEREATSRGANSRSIGAARTHVHDAGRECEARALALGLQLGGNGAAFAGSYTISGCTPTRPTAARRTLAWPSGENAHAHASDWFADYVGGALCGVECPERAYQRAG